MFSNYRKSFFQIEEHTSSYQMELALIDLMSAPKGPCSYKYSFRRTIVFYSEYSTSKKFKVELNPSSFLVEEDKELVTKVWSQTDKKLLIIGQMIPNQRLQIVLDTLGMILL